MMNIKAVLLVVGLALTFGASQFWPEEDYTERDTVLIHAVTQMMNRLHYNPVDMNDEYSENVFDTYIDRTDGGRRFFTQEDLQKLTPYKSKLDDEIKAGSFKFFDLSLKLLKEGQKEAETYYNYWIERPFEYDTEETINRDWEDVPFAEDADELKEYWRKLLKYEILVRVNNKLEKQEADNYEGEAKPLDTLEKKARSQVKETFDEWFNRLDNNRRVDYLTTYLNSVTNVWDPHTGYYKPKDKEDFDLRMSNQLEGIGARLTTEGNYIKVVEIVPGGPAWKQGDLEKEDFILKVAQEDEEPVDAVGMHIDDVVSMIRGKKGTKVTLTVKKVNGTIQEITITRDIVEFEEGYAKSLILKREGGDHDIGYINLPSFYADFDNSGGRSSADDVRKEVTKLRESGVDGIILDLRNNGGGSLRDVVEMSGLFFDKGPIVQVKARNRKPYILDDESEEVVYDGPLIVMVNHYSASASEILAAAMQDYERALVVGSNNTFGKGTVQRFYNLDQTVKSSKKDVKPLGEVKITTQKFYRIDGGSTQRRGVKPDILLPDRFDLITVGEREYEYAMDWTKIDPVDYSQETYKVQNIESLRRQSQERVEQSEVFQKVRKYAEFTKEQRENRVYELDLEDFRAEVQNRQETVDEFNETMNQKTENLSVSYIPSDVDHIESDSTRLARFQDFEKDVSKDVYLDETLSIMYDMIESREKGSAESSEEGSTKSLMKRRE